MLSTAAESRVLLAQLVMAAVRTVVLAAGAGLLLGLFRVKAAAARLFIWTAVLYAGLSIPVLAWLLPPMLVPVPFLESPVLGGEKAVPRMSSDRAPSFSRGSERAAKTSTAGSGQRSTLLNVQTADARARFWTSWMGSLDWTSFAAATYLAVAAWLFSRFLVGLAFAHRLVRSSKPIEDSRVTVRLSSYAHFWGQRVVPRAQESPRVSVPVTIGVLTPAILLPSDWQEWPDAKLDAVICHEMSHVRRRDALSQCASLLYRAFFWFSPLAWWLNRHIAELAEEVSDEAALSSGAERNRYATTLLEFFEAVHGAHRRIHWQGVPIANAGHAEKRLRKILEWRGGNPRRWKKSAMAIFLACASPLVYLAAAALPAHHPEFSQDTKGAQEQVPPPAAGAPSGPPPPASAPASPSSPPAPANGGISNSGPPPAEPSSPVSPPAPGEPTSPASSESYLDQDSGTRHGHGYSYAYGFDDEQRFVIVSGKTSAFTMSGTSEDARHVEKLRKRISGDFIWFQRDEKSYIIRDPATIERARRLWAPQEELGRKQEELGKQQEALGKQQEELGARMEQVRVKVPDMTAELDKLKAELQQLGTSASVEQIARIQSEIGELQGKIGDIQAHAGDQQGKLGEEMGALGERQGRLGQQQGELGRQQAELAEKATRGMKELLDDAIKRGIARPESDETGGASI